VTRAQQLRRALLERERDWRRIFVDRDIPFLMSLMVAVDSRTGDTFTFEHLREPLEPGEVWVDDDGYTLRCAGWDGPANDRGGKKNWRWQRYIVDRRIARNRRIDLKGRQIGDTWVNLGYDVACAILMPGSTSLLFRQREDEAIDNARRWWTLYQSLPRWVVDNVPGKSGRRGPIVISKPSRGDRPGRDGITLRFPDGRFSDVVPQTSAAGSGHGSSTRDILLDEAAHIEALEEIRAGVEPSAGEASIGLISTANGRHNAETGDGNHFHWVWSNAEDSGYDRLFLPYNLHPDRDDYWYENAPEIRSLPRHRQMEQFPRNAKEAFALSDRTFFDEEALLYYAEHCQPPLYRAVVRFDAAWQASIVRKRDGFMRVYREPVDGRDYAIAADPASGHGRDSSAAYVIDLETCEFVAEYKRKVGEKQFAADLYWLGKWYGGARIAVETQGGHGTATVLALKDGGDGRTPYTNLYYHRREQSRKRPDAQDPGYPMDPKNRAQLVNLIEWHVREKSLPFVTDELHHEMTEFIEADSGPSPRARDGSHDDMVFAAAGALEMFRRYGATLTRAVRRRPNDSAPPREKQTPKGFNEARYPKSTRS